jgi:hypothetical protein
MASIPTVASHRLHTPGTRQLRCDTLPTVVRAHNQLEIRDMCYHDESLPMAPDVVLTEAKCPTVGP